MTTRKIVAVSTALAAVMSIATPLFAQRGRSEERAQPQREAGQAGRRPEPQARPEAPRQQSPQSPRPESQPSRQAPPSRQPQAQPQRSAQPQRQAPERSDARPQTQAPRADNGTRAQAPQVNDRPRPQAGPQAGPRPAQPRPQPQQTTVYRGGTSSRDQYGRPGTYQAPRNYGRPQSSSYGGYNRGYREIRVPVFTRPYYSFRPRISIGFGISIGYSVAYPFQYYDPYGFYNYRIGVLPGYRTPTTRGYNSGYNPYYDPYYDRVGGLSFNIDPSDADVYIDGEYVGYADDFSPGQMPLTLTAGRHRVELEAPGFMPVSFDITVVAGQVIPYAGTLPYLR